MNARVVWLAVYAALACGVSGCGRTTPPPEAPLAEVSVIPDRTSVSPGQLLELKYRFTRMQGAPAPSTGSWVFVHFLDEGGRLLWTDDHQPPVPPEAWGPEPIEYERALFVPRMRLVGELSIVVGLVNPASAERATLRGHDRGGRAYDAASVMIALPGDAGLPDLGDGWYAVERTDAEPGRPWQWSAAVGRLSFPNPRRDSSLVLELDQPIAAVAPQRVELRIGAEVVGILSPVPGKGRTIERIPVPAGSLGMGDEVELTVAVDPTFVPASMAGLANSDTRTLGVRLFNAQLSAR